MSTGSDRQNDAHGVRGESQQATRAAHPVLVALGALVVFTALGHDAWRLAFGLPVAIVVGLATTVLCVVALAIARPRIPWRRVSWTLVAFLGWCVLSTLWSAYTVGTVAALALQWSGLVAAGFLAFVFSRRELIHVLGLGLRWLLGLSLAFEVIVGVFVRHPVLPGFATASGGDVSVLDYWSRDHLFDGERIQGIVGNADVLSFLALLGLIVFGAEVWDRQVRRGSGLAWVGMAALMLALSRSATLIIAAVAVAFALVVVFVARRARSAQATLRVYMWSAVIGVTGLVAALIYAEPLLHLLGRDITLTYRTSIWHSVTAMAVQHPVAGWGFSSPWMPWAAPLKELVVVLGSQQLEAHNAWLDIWMQTGLIGALLFALVVIGFLWRSLFVAVGRPWLVSGAKRMHYAVTLVPLSLGVVLLVSSVAGSWILYLGGWTLLATLALHVTMAASREDDVPGGMDTEYDILETASLPAVD